MKSCKITKQNIITAVLALFILLTLCVIWGHSLEGPEASSAKSQAVLEHIIKPILGPIFGREHITEYFVRKLGHFTEFFVLGAECIALLWVRRKVRLHWIVHTLCFGFLVGALDETLQIFTRRGSSLSDVWLDFTGFTVAVGLSILGYWIWKRVKRMNLNPRE